MNTGLTPTNNNIFHTHEWHKTIIYGYSINYSHSHKSKKHDDDDDDGVVCCFWTGFILLVLLLVLILCNLSKITGIRKCCEYRTVLTTRAENVWKNMCCPSFKKEKKEGMPWVPVAAAWCVLFAEIFMCLCFLSSSHTCRNLFHLFLARWPSSR